jgi:radical SAM enzyme (TIGR01210 family)
MAITTKPVAVWVEKERFKGEIVDCLTVILRTRGCSWNKCLMCGYKKDTSKEVTTEDLKKQIDGALSREAVVLKIFTSGSFFELNKDFRHYVYSKVEEMGFEKLIVESRPEFIGGVLDELSSLSFEVEVGIGLETANDFVREHCINKGFTFEDFKKSAELLKSIGVRVKAYLLLKPPFLSEWEAIDDALNSVNRLIGLVDVVSLNPMNVPSDTYVEKLWIKGLYRPPWLWSVVEVLKNSPIEIISDPVGGGSIRGPHNCGRCDKRVVKAIKTFSLTQDKSIFDGLQCKCIEIWRKVTKLEDYSRIPLVK